MISETTTCAAHRVQCRDRSSRSFRISFAFSSSSSSWLCESRKRSFSRAVIRLFAVEIRLRSAWISASSLSMCV